MRRPRRARPQLVELEDRVTPATLYTVSGAGNENTRDDVLTLREALLAQRGDVTLSAGELVHVAANAAGLTRDTIGFAPVLGGRTITFGANDTATANRYGATGFVITKAVTIDGTAGSGLGVTVSGGNARRLFAVTSTGDLGLVNLTLADGLAQGGAGGAGGAGSKGSYQSYGGGGGGAAGLGGAVFVDGGVLTITAGTLTGNRAAGGAGGFGGSFQQGGGTQQGGGGGTGADLGRGGSSSLVFAGAGFGGGGAGGGAQVNPNSPPFPFPTTTTTPGAAGGFGGGGGAAGTISPLAGGRGGGGAGFGGAVFNNAGTVTITNSTLTANSAVGGSGATAGKGHGGAVFSRNGTLTITSSTLSANTAANGGTGVYVLADKVSAVAGDTRNTGAAAVTITGSILGQAANTVTDLATATNGTGAVVTAGGSFNLIRNTAVGGVGSVSAADPWLSALGSFGGPTRTMALLAGSPALDAGDPAATGPDQRGLLVQNGRRDAGAFEQLVSGAVTILAPGALPTRPVGQPYNETFTAAGTAGPYTFGVFGGALPTGLTLSPAGVLSGAATATGVFTFTVVAIDPTGASGRRDYTLVVVPGVTVTPAALPAAAVEAAYSQTLTAAGPAGPYTFAVTAGSLPDGLTLTGAGVLAGTPTAPGGATFTVTATSAEGFTGTRAYTLTVGAVVVAVGPTTLPAATRGTGYAQALTATGSASPFTFAVTAGSLPPGLTLAADGALAGTVPPGATQSFTFTVTATSATGYTGTRAYTLAVDSPVVIAPATLPAATQGQPYSQAISATGAAGPFTFALAAGSLPAGLALDADGTLAGTPTAGGNFAFTVTATSADGHSNSRAYTLAAYTTSLVVTSLADDGGPGTLRSVLATANATPGTQPVAITFAVDGTITLGTAQLAVTRTSGPVVIDGGGRNVTLGGGGRTRILQTAANTTVSLARLTLTGGNGSGGGSEGSGGALLSNGTLTLTDVTATGNTARLNGGVIYQHNAVLTIVRGTFTNNSAGYSAGAVAQNRGSLVVTDSTFAGGHAGFGGGAIYGNGPSSTTISGSTFTGNSAGSYGGAIDFEIGSSVTVSRSTFTGNTAVESSGAIGGEGALVVRDSTVVGNSARNQGGLGHNANGTLTLSGSIVAGNTLSGTGGVDPDVGGGGGINTDGGYNLLGTALQGATNGVGNVYTNTPGVAALADNGGPTRTMALLPGSGAADAGNPSSATADQRGVAVHNGRRDIGAFEGDGVTVGPGALPAATQGTAYSQALVASGAAGPFTFAVTAGALPAGLTLTAAGVLSGTPTAAGTATFTVTATGAAATGLRAYTLVVNPVVVTLTPATLPGAVASRPYAQTLTATAAAGPFTFAVTAGALPVGLSLSAAGLLSGTPIVEGSTTFTVTATSAAGYTGSRVYTFSAVAGLYITPQVPQAAAVGVAFGEQLVAAGGSGAVAFAQQGGDLPPGLTLTAAGLLGGTPTAAGRFTFGVAATAANGVTGYQQFTVIVAPARALTPAAMPQGQVGQRVELTFGLTAATMPYTYAVTAGALPPGLYLAGGILRGTPATAGTYSFTVTATSAEGVASRAYTYRVAAAPVRAPAAYVVTSLADDASPGTLRYAVNAANADTTSAPITITFAVSGTIVLTGGSIDLIRAGGPVTIDATGHPITLDANRAGRVLYNVATGPVTLAGLTLRNGRTDPSTSGDSGAGILNGGVLTLVRVAVLDNDATYSGGGIYNGNTVHLIDSTVAGNTCAYVGGGVYNGTGATLTAVNSTLANNTAGNGGFVFNGGTFTATDCTIAGNAARYTGGGVYNGATFSVVGSIVANNVLIGTGGLGPNVYAGITTDGGHNLLSPELRAATPAAGNVYSAAPGLAPLADNGGPTPTMALLPGSPAIDAARPTDATADQRGVAVQNGRRDIGAYESGYTPPPAPVGTTTTAAGATATYGGDQAVTLTATVTGVGGTVTFEVTNAAGARIGTTVTAAVTGGSATAAYTLPGRTAVGGYRVTATYSGAAGYTASSATATLTVTPRALTLTGLTAADKVYDDTTTAVLVTGSTTLVGVVAGDAVALNTTAASARFASAHAAADVPVTVAGLALSGAAAGNYTLVTPAATATILPRSLTVTAAANTKPFDGTTSAAAAPVVVGLQGDDAAAFAETYADPAVGTGKLLTPAGVVIDGNGGANYSVTLVSAATGTITASLTSSVELSFPATVEYGTPVTLTATVTSGSGTPTGAVTFYDVTAGVSLGAGTNLGGGVWAYTTGVRQLAVSPARLVRAVFTPTGPFLGGEATKPIEVTPRALTVTGLTAMDKVYDDTTGGILVSGGAALDRVVAGDVVGLIPGTAVGTFASRHVGVAIPVTVTGLTLTGADAGNYTLAGLTLSAAITPRPLTVTPRPNTKPFDGTVSAAALPTVVGLQGDDVASFAETYADPAVGINKVLTPAGSVDDENGGANYAVTLVSAPVGVILPSLGTGVVVTLPAAVGYGTPVALTARVTSGAGTPTGAVMFYDDTAGRVLGTGVDLGDGVWAYTAGAGQLDAAPARTVRAVFTATGSYLGSAAAATVAVAPRTLTVTGLRAADKVYDGTTAAALDTAAAALGRVIAGDDVALNAAGATGAFASADAATGVPVAVSGLAVTGGDAANYTLPAPVLTATVAPAPVAVALAPVSGTAGRPVALTAAVSGAGGPLSAGTVTFTVLGATVVAPVVGGVATATVTLPADAAAGTYAVRAGYSGAANLAPADATTALALTAAPTDPPAEPDPNLVGVPPVVVGADAAGGGTVTVINPDGSAGTFTPFPGTGVPVRTAAADFNRDGTPDVVAGTGPGAAAQVTIFDGRTGAVLFDTRPFDDFTGGVFVSAADLTGDGVPELVVTPDQSGGPRVVIYDGSGFTPMASFLGIDDANFRGGARAGVGDVNADGFADLVLSAGFGGGPRVAVFDGKALAAGRVERLVNDFFLFEEGLRNGAYVAVGDVDGDGYADVVGGAGPGGAPRVLVLSGRQLLTAGAGAALAAPVADFFAGNSDNRGGVRVATKNLDADRFADVVVGDAAGTGSRLRAYLGRDLTAGTVAADYELDAFPGTLGGVYVG